MTGKDHLGTNEELTEFSIEMATQLNIHREEKQSMREWDFESVMSNNVPQIRNRIEIIERNMMRIKSDWLYSKADTISFHLEIKKQWVHIANYSMMGYLKS